MAVYTKLRRRNGLCVVLLAAFTLAVLACGGVDPTQSAPASPTSAAQERTPSPTPPPPITGDRLRIPSIGVDAPVSRKPVDARGALPNADTPDDIVLADFTNWPGLGGIPGEGNTLLLGNLDSGSRPCQNGSVPPPCRAVFWDLNGLRRGGEVMLDYEGVRRVYSVAASCYIERTSRDLDRAAARPSTGELLTLLTAAGNFVDGSYTGFRIVIAEATPGSMPQECGFGSQPPTPLPMRTPTPVSP